MPKRLMNRSTMKPWFWDYCLGWFKRLDQGCHSKIWLATSSILHGILAKIIISPSAGVYYWQRAFRTAMDPRSLWVCCLLAPWCQKAPCSLPGRTLWSFNWECRMTSWKPLCWFWAAWTVVVFVMIICHNMLSILSVNVACCEGHDWRASERGPISVQCPDHWEDGREQTAQNLEVRHR